MIDFHSHLIPCVDDGARNLDEARTALATLRAQGVTTLVTTPHFRGALTQHPYRLRDTLAILDEGWEKLHNLAATEFPELRVERGVEIMLDTPDPILTDGRLRLAATSFVLVEFTAMSVPPNSTKALFDLKIRGWTPIIAHPERYSNMGDSLGNVQEWRNGGAGIQVNCGSFLGAYGARAKERAWKLLRNGWIDYLSSDYHARGSCYVERCRAELVAEGAEEQVHLLTEVNPGRLLAGEPPLEVPALKRERPPLWKRIFT